MKEYHSGAGCKEEPKRNEEIGVGVKFIDTRICLVIPGKGNNTNGAIQ